MHSLGYVMGAARDCPRDALSSLEVSWGFTDQQTQTTTSYQLLE